MPKIDNWHLYRVHTIPRGVEITIRRRKPDGSYQRISFVLHSELADALARKIKSGNVPFV